MMNLKTYLLFSLVILSIGVYSIYVPVYVMMPLDVIDSKGNVNNINQLRGWFQKLKNDANVDGIMCDVWWGVVEVKPQTYNWNGYRTLFSLAQEYGLKVQAVMSFHTCGGNVGDNCNITLPQWIIGKSNIYYKDRYGNQETDYISWSQDKISLDNGRTTETIYGDFMSKFASYFKDLLGSTIDEIQVGLGPAGELRYPSYPLDKWSFPHVGEFQCYDSLMLADLEKYARSKGHPEWGKSGPNNQGNYNSDPDNTGFFNPNCNCDNYKSTYGQFFLDWYFLRLVEHGQRILNRANIIFRGTGASIAAKVSGIHWQYRHPSHAAELTAGYKNDLEEAYIILAEMFQSVNATMIFTCLEMRDSEQQGCNCSPESLIAQTKMAAKAYGLRYSGENALERYDNTAYDQIVYQATKLKVLHAFTYLRLNNNLFNGGNWDNFKGFVYRMHNL